MHPTVKNSAAFAILLAIGTKEWLSSLSNVIRLVTIFAAGAYFWVAARLFMYESTFASPNIRDWAAILSLGIAIFMTAAAFPRGWARTRRFLKI